MKLMPITEARNVITVLRSSSRDAVEQYDLKIVVLAELQVQI